MMRSIVFLIALSSLTFCKRKHDDSEVQHATAASATTTQVVLRATDKETYFSDPSNPKISANATFKITIKNRTKKERFFSINIQGIVPDTWDHSQPFTPPPSGFTIAAGKDSADAFFDPYNHSYSAVYSNTIAANSNLNMTVTKIPDFMVGGNLYISGNYYEVAPLQESESGSFVYRADAENSLNLDLMNHPVVIAATDSAGKQLQDGARVIMDITTTYNVPGFSRQAPSEDAAGLISLPALGFSENMVPGIVGTYERDGKVVDLSKLIANVPQSEFVGGQTSITLPVIYTPGKPQMLKIKIPKQGIGVITGTFSIRTFELESSSQVVSTPIPEITTVPITFQNSKHFQADYVTPWGGSSGTGALINDADSESHIDTNVVIDVHADIGAAQDLPVFQDESLWQWETFEGSTSRDKYNGNYLGLLYYPDGTTPLRALFKNPTVMPHGVVRLSLYLNKKKSVIEDLTDEQINSFPSNSAALANLFTQHDLPQGIPGPGNIYLFDSDVMNAKGTTNPGSYQTQLTDPLLKFGEVAIAGSQQLLPAREILLAMEEARNRWQTVVARSKKSDRDPRYNVIDGTFVDGCLGNAAEHWSDLTLHYYCQFGVLRACYTNSIREIAGKLQEIAPQATTPALKQELIFKLSQIRHQAFDKCAEVGKNALPDADPDSEEAQWKWLTDPAFPQRAQVFRFVMEAPTFSMSYKLQQNILNAFYRVPLPNNEVVKGDSDPDSVDPVECNKYRISRSLERRDSSGESTDAESFLCGNLKKTLVTAQKAAMR
jgi:hypothetical protein